MMASEWEFRHRVWIIGAVFCLAFSCYFLDHRNIVEWMLKLAGHGNARAIRSVIGIGAALVLVSAFLRTWAAAYLHAGIVHDAVVHTHQLVADGPYRYVRNPLCLGNVLLALGMGLMASRLGFVVLVVGNIWFLLRLIAREEHELSSSQGAGYRAYLARVPRLFPSLIPRVPSGGRRPDWGQGIVGEAMFWTFAAAVVAFTITLSMRWFMPVLIAAFPLKAICAKFYRRPEAKHSAAAR